MRIWWIIGGLAGLWFAASVRKQQSRTFYPLQNYAPPAPGMSQVITPDGQVVDFYAGGNPQNA